MGFAKFLHSSAQGQQESTFKSCEKYGNLANGFWLNNEKRKMREEMQSESESCAKDLLELLTSSLSTSMWILSPAGARMVQMHSVCWRKNIHSAEQTWICFLRLLHLRWWVWIVWRHDNLLFVVWIQLNAASATVGQLSVLQHEPSTLRGVVGPGF